MKKQFWNKGWEYLDSFTEDFILGGAQSTVEVELPHSNCMLPHNYFDESIYQKLCGYRKSFFAPEDWRNKQVRLVLGAAAHHASVYLNGAKLAEHAGGYTGFSVALDSNLNYGQENLLAIRLDSRETLNIPPFGKVIDYMTFGGLYREAWLEINEPCHIEDCFVSTPDLNTVQIKTSLALPEGAAGLEMRFSLVFEGEVLASYTCKADSSFTVSFAVPGALPWDLDSPRLYSMQSRLYDGQRLLDEHETTFGFRTARFESDGFYLNGKKLKLLGLNRHQSYPTVGYAMPERQQAQDARILKNELCVNAVRTSHYPQSHAFIGECDRLGLLVFMELPGWQHIGDAAWKDIACEMTREMITEYRNHPSIIIWGVRINESQDDDEFYTRTNAIAHELDPSRQTSGVRFVQKSSLLEDVYSYNDFSHNGITPGVEPKKKVTPDMTKPYLITEYNGHMFPTKSYDWEEKRLEHALRHARVIDGYYGHEDICGGFGWCMFDYHTHRDFGSGDRICYHGVLDIYRNPKLAAAVYKSQLSKEPVLETSSSMDIGEHPVGNLGTVYAFTNADSVRLYKNDEFIREFFPDRASFPNMPHPPVRIDDFVGNQLIEKEGFDEKTSNSMKEIMNAVASAGLSNLSLGQKLKMIYYMQTRHLSFDDCYRIFGTYMSNWGGEAIRYRFDAIKDGELVKTVYRQAFESFRIDVSADTSSLKLGEGYDVASLRIRCLDQNGNLLPYYQEPLRLEASGAIRLIGEDIISLKGGCGGAYVRSVGEAGKGWLKVSGNGFAPLMIEFIVE